MTLRSSPVDHTGVSAEWIAVVIALVAVGVSVTVAVVSGFRRMDDRLARLDDRLRDTETRLDERLRNVEGRLDERLLVLDARLRNVETGLAFLRGRLQEDDPQIEPEPPPAEPAPERARQTARA